jgi:hypothetical protein
MGKSQHNSTILDFDTRQDISGELLSPTDLPSVPHWLGGLVDPEEKRKYFTLLGMKPRAIKVLAGTSAK